MDEYMRHTEYHMNLNCNGNQYRFARIPLYFSEETFTDVFSRKNNKSLAQTTVHRRYLSLASESHRNYAKELRTPIGTFLMRLKQRGDNFYKKFLNPYGDLSYSKFWIEEESALRSRGLYLYADNGHLLYIGRCKDSFRKRIIQGYGSIQPKNCFIDGQATNCHINSLITGLGRLIQFEVCPIPDIPTIIAVESAMIKKYKPKWNIQGV